ncbi:Meiotic activator RIM4 [Cytospora mali]|uniref:Meiotic activator RIM4 n=1 Tax=Cytospora mali TaxID=578113 RepID=A0A194VPA1_CYTMA|nr:Meiotic activator RIM4 [Valsa mali]
MAYTSKSYDPSPERFQRTKGVAITGSDRVASPSVSSSAGDSDTGDTGGVRLDTVSISGSPKYTPPHTRLGLGNPRFARSIRSATDSPTGFATADDGDDVFVTSPTKALRERRSERSIGVGNMRRLDVALANEDHTLRSHSSNLSARHQINGIDAQNLYPPTACVFVANLPEPKDDVALEAAIYREFLQYGKCWVKIRRDSHHMPFAFVQFTSDEEARDALERGKGAMICGRSCRTEMVKANRTFIIQKKSGSPMTVQEAQEVLLPYGSLSKCELLHPQLREPLNFPPTVLIEFSMFDATRDLHTAFRHDPVYTVTAFDLKKNCANTRSNSDEAFLAACERDRRSIFIGDLPGNVTQEDLEELFSEAGEILKVNLIQKENNSRLLRTMAFIEYSQPDMPETAVAKFHGSVFKGAIIRVERKSVKDRGPTPRQSRSQILLPQLEDSPISRAPPKSPTGPQVVSTPTRPTVATTEMSPAPMPPMYGGWSYGMPGSPYTTQQNYAATYGIPGSASGNMPMTPQATPQMPSPWSYYNGYWPGMMSYDPSAYYMGAYAFQSPTPMAGGGRADEQGQLSPTRGRRGGENGNGEERRKD